MNYNLTNLSSAEMEYIGNKLLSGEIAVIPTDTQYGIVTSALNEQSVEKIYQLRKRSSDKPMIILISEISQIENLGINLSPNQLNLLQKFWPNPVSIIISADDPSLKYLHRGKNSLAFRLPNLKWLRELIQVSGPLVAPSANPEGMPPAVTIEEAEKYFGGGVNFYLNNGELNNSPSTIIKLTNKNFDLIRTGAYKL